MLHKINCDNRAVFCATRYCGQLLRKGEKDIHLESDAIRHHKNCELMLTTTLTNISLVMSEKLFSVSNLHIEV